MKRGPRINSPVSGVSKHTTFDEFWQKEDELWALSMAESFRQRDERHKKLKTCKNEHGEYIGQLDKRKKKLNAKSSTKPSTKTNA
tara:strand:- start:207 stop:461 length:255 start_codon:yes stop_codon:yes gene_type:complete